MQKQLRKNPKMLALFLKKRRDDTQKELFAAVIRNDMEAVSRLSDSLNQIDEALQQLALKAAPEGGGDDSEAPQEPGHFGDGDETSLGMDEEAEEADNDAEDDVQDEDKDSGFNFQQPSTDDDEEEVENPVAMSSSLRRQMGDAAADFLDDYALTVYKKILSYIKKIRDVALELGAEEDPDDGITALRESLKEEIGRRGLAAVEPVFEDWRAGVFRVISKEIKDMFQPPEAPVDLTDSDVGSLLGLDEVSEDMEAADELEKAGKEPEEAEAEVAKKGPEKAAEGVQGALSRQAPAPLAIATGPVSMRISGRQPVTASSTELSSTAAKARDFIPSGGKSPTLC